MTRVLMIASNGFTHDPRIAAEATSLTGAGYEVTVLAWDRTGTLELEESRGGVRIVRVRTTVGMRLRMYDFFRLKPFWGLAVRRALALHGERPFDVVHCHDLDTLPAGVVLKERLGTSLVYDAHEIFPYMMELSRARRWAGRWEAMERRLVPSADLIVAAGPAHRDYLLRSAKARIAVVTNSKPLLWDAYEPPRNDRMTVGYFGGLEPTRLLLPLAELAVEEASFAVEVAGDGPLAAPLQSLAAKSRGNLRFLGVIPMADVLSRTRACDVVFAVFDPSQRLNRIGAPNKFFEALVTGRPALVSRGTWVGSEVEANECGLAIEYSKGALRDALTTLRSDGALRERLGRNALSLAKERYNWAREEATLLDAYRSLGFRFGAKT